jgi:hypothetical protein
MSTIINATTTNGVVIQPDNSGSLVLQSNGTTIMTVGSTGVSTQVGAPAFSAYAGAVTSMANSTFTKVNFDTEEFDTNSNFASSRFTPTVAGYYQINSVVGFASGTYKTELGIYKNGSIYKYGMYPNQATVDTNFTTISSLIYLNGSTDYVEIYGYQTSGGALNTVTNSSSTWFNGSMVRSA